VKSWAHFKLFFTVLQTTTVEVVLLQQKAKDVVTFRQQKIRQQQTDKDYEIIRRKAELHYSEYREMRQKQLDMGRRINALYRHQRTKEVIDTNVGPQLCVVIKGSYILFALLI